MSATKKEVIWYLNHYATNPNVGKPSRASALGEEWVKLGAEVRVVASSYHHFLSAKINTKERSHTLNGVKYHFLNNIVYEGNGITRLLNMLIYSFLLLFLRSKGEKPDYIIVSSVHPFHFFSGQFLAWRYKAKLVFEVRDIWPASLVQISGLSEACFLFKLLAFIERYAYRHSDLVVSLMQNSRQHIEAKAGHSVNFVCIPNGFLLAPPSEEAFGNDEPLLKEIARLKELGKMVVFYGGSIGPPNNIELLIGAAESPAVATDVHFVIVGGGISQVEVFARAQKLGNVSCFESVPKNVIEKALENVDCAYVGAKDIPLYKLGVSPNKMFESMALGVPLIVAIDSPNNPVEAAACGLCVSPTNAEGIVSAIKKLKCMNNDELHRLGDRGRRYVNAEHSYSVLAAKFLSELRSLNGIETLIVEPYLTDRGD